MVYEVNGKFLERVGMGEGSLVRRERFWLYFCDGNEVRFMYELEFLFVRIFWGRRGWEGTLW